MTRLVPKRWVHKAHTRPSQAGNMKYREVCDSAKASTRGSKAKQYRQLVSSAPDDERIPSMPVVHWTDKSGVLPRTPPVHGT